jgi:WD40 repeat protein
LTPEPGDNLTANEIKPSLRPLPLVGIPIGVRAFHNFRNSIVLVLASEAIININSGVVRIIGVRDNIICNAAILNRSTHDFETIVVGYANGLIELHRTNPWTVEPIDVCDAAITAISTLNGHDLFAAADASGLVMVWRAGQLHFVKAHAPPVRAMTLIDEGKKLVTVDSENVLSVWDISNFGDTREIDFVIDCALFAGTEIYDEWIAIACDAGELLISEPDFFGNQRRLTLGVGRDGALAAVKHTRLGWFSFHEHGWVNSKLKAWATRAPVIVVVDMHKDANDFIVSAKCHRFWLDDAGTGRTQSVDLPLRNFSYLAVSEDGQTCIMMDQNWELFQIGFDLNPASAVTSLTRLKASKRGMREHLNALYISHEAKHFVIVLGEYSFIAIYSTKSQEWTEYQSIGPGKRDELRGGHHFSADGRSLYAALLSGGIVKFDLSEFRVAITERYIQPQNRFSEFSEHTILWKVESSQSGNWIIASGDTLLFIWRRGVSTPKEITLKERLRLIRFLPDSEMFATLDDERECNLWSAPSGALLRHVASNVRNVVVSENGKYLGVIVSDRSGIRTLKIPIFSTRQELLAELEKAQHALAARS